MVFAGCQTFLSGGLKFLWLLSYGIWILIHPWCKFLLSLLILKVQRTSMCFKSSFGALEDTGVWYLDLNMDMVTGFLYTHVPNLCPLLWFWSCKEHPCALSPHLGLWRMLEVPHWGLASWSSLGYGPWSLIFRCSEFWLYILVLKDKKHPCPLSPHLGLWRMLYVPDWALASWSWFEYIQEPCLDLPWSFDHSQFSWSCYSLS